VIALPLLLLLGAGAGSPLPREAMVDKGRALYMAHCSRCHGASAIGDGPDAALLRNRPADLRRSEVLDSFSDEKLAERIREGKVMRLAFRPESISKQAADTEALYQFLQKLPVISWKSVDAGERIYYERCTPCHDRYGRPEPGLPPGVMRRPQDLSDPLFQSAVSDRELRRLVRHGRGSMPAVLPQVTEPESVDLVRFVRVLSPGYEIYDRFCSACHGPRGEGATGALLTGPAPNFAFDAAYFRTRTGDETRQAIWHMLEDKTPTMPHFEDTLTAAEVKAILLYLHSLPRLPSDTSGEHRLDEGAP
jgi:mono/diheme cytochrome c family protein